MTMNLRRPTKRSALMPTEAELEILNTLWTIGPSTVREVHDALSSKRTGYTTVLKQMQLANNLLHRAFNGSAKNLVLGALSSQRVSSSELAEIRRMLDEFEKGSA
jgi:BlaI family penicillinase repressor